jgi:hypothetical protein
MAVGGSGKRRFPLREKDEGEAAQGVEEYSKRIVVADTFSVRKRESYHLASSICCRRLSTFGRPKYLRKLLCELLNCAMVVAASCRPHADRSAMVVFPCVYSRLYGKEGLP